MASKILTTTTILITTNKNQQLRLHHKLSLFLNHPLQKVFLKLKHLNEKKLTGVEKFKKVYDLPLHLLQYRRENSAEY